ncbi:uncharacterized protein A4U43_C05F7560 [Asparagus officinalis]|uniref:Uncharacterized protein n=1 Tax=Asparagus officinalis TaxID=4686 RepID=A0A5P1EUC8_ASPOF|nr:uncharacterized protein A4U43_C05F7560 [Asparagus officinalis]
MAPHCAILRGTCAARRPPLSRTDDYADTNGDSYGYDFPWLILCSLFVLISNALSILLTGDEPKLVVGSEVAPISIPTGDEFAPTINFDDASGAFEPEPTNDVVASPALALVSVVWHSKKEELVLKLSELANERYLKASQLQAEMARLEVIRIQATLIEPRILRKRALKDALNAKDVKMAEYIARITISSLLPWSLDGPST